MKNKITIVLMLCPWLAMAQVPPMQHNQWTTNVPPIVAIPATNVWGSITQPPKGTVMMSDLTYDPTFNFLNEVPSSITNGASLVFINNNAQIHNKLTLEADLSVGGTSGTSGMLLSSGGSGSALAWTKNLSAVTNYGSNLADGSSAANNTVLTANGSGGTTWAAGGGGGYAFLGPYNGADATLRAFTGGSTARFYPLVGSGPSSASAASVGMAPLAIAAPFTITNMTVGAAAAAVGSSAILTFGLIVNGGVAVHTWVMQGTATSTGQATNFDGDSYTVAAGSITNQYIMYVTNSAASGASGTISTEWSFQVIK